ncbi:MAG: hypothetical protein CO149_04545 [Nitrospirae bacterium CG_4_9_14_3_um_filter_51_5]|nr:MAG: hypothetical protein CO149_04545 [Nitrospirae bacterium CG_4_9_14_3_um_filter_51_5]
MRTFKLRFKAQWPEFFLWSAEEKLKKIKIVKDKKDRQENIDNHSGQNYNVEHFCICTHDKYLFFYVNS